MGPIQNVYAGDTKPPKACRGCSIPVITTLTSHLRIATKGRNLRASWCLSQILRTTFLLGFERGLYGVSGVSSGLFTLMGDTSRLFHIRSAADFPKLANFDSTKGLF